MGHSEIISLGTFGGAFSGARLQAVRGAVRVIGIDLGTTNSVVAEIVWDPNRGEPPAVKCLEVVQETPFGNYVHTLVPSVVAIADGKVWIGEGAKRLRADARLRRNRDIFYECKNEMGVRRTYHLAPEGFRCAAEISARILDFLRRAYLEADPKEPDRVVVTVPASFQLPQREDTFRAADLAGIPLQSGDLLDEPVAAFIDYVIRHREAVEELLHGEKNLLVFDFGGGTCDVAVIRLFVQPADRTLAASPLAVSRYHRLGGGDIDAAIVHQVLIPQLIQQRNLQGNELDYEARKLYIEPALLSVAEALKTGLCTELNRLRKFSQPDPKRLQQLTKKQPGRWPCPCPGYPDLALEGPTLSADQFEQVLEPFLDRDFLYPRETEYYLTQSIFGPLQDALQRAGLSRRDVDLVQLVGGSSLIPQVRDAVAQYFDRARILTDDDPEAMQLGVARGAAWHALWLAVFGRGFIQPVAHDAVALRTASGLLELIPKGVSLPYPSADGWIERVDLVVPQTSLHEPLKLRVEVVAVEDSRTLSSRTWLIRPPVNRGQALRLRARMDANQCLRLELSLKDDVRAEPFACTLENPLTVVLNPNQIRQRIEEKEELLRTVPKTAEEVAEALAELATDYAELGQYDKAIFYLQQAMRRRGRPVASWLNLMGIFYGRKGDTDREIKSYQEALRADPGDTAASFNLALAYERLGQREKALAELNRALAVGRGGPYLVLLTRILRGLGRSNEADAALKEAFERFGPVSTLDDWELAWYQHGAQIAGDEKRLKEAAAERQKRRKGLPLAIQAEGALPELQPAVMRK